MTSAGWLAADQTVAHSEHSGSQKAACSSRCIVQANAHTWVAAGALEQADVEDELYAAAEVNHLVADDGSRQTWATIRSGLSAGLQQPIDLDVADRKR